MIGIFQRLSQKAGLPPGIPVHVGEKKVEKTRITVIDYDETRFEARELEDVRECLSYKDTPTVTWINVDGLHDVPIIEQLGSIFGIHPLILEDIVNTQQRPKLELFDGCLFIVVKLIFYDAETSEIETEQVSIVAGDTFVLTFQERHGDIFDPLRTRIRNGKGLARKGGTGYLIYGLLDALVDSYFGVLDRTGDQIEALEEEIAERPNPVMLRSIHTVKRNMAYLRKSVWPLREIIGGLERGESPIVRDSLRIYLRDLYDHTIQVIDTVETMRDIITGMLDIYLSSVSNRMNEVMKVLTIFASIFIPLTFIAGVYGMNFEYMPELRLRWGYFAVLGVMSAIGLVLLAFFKRKKWL